MTAAFALLCAGDSFASEIWQAVAWKSDAGFIAEFDAMCTERGLASFDVLEANGYPGSGKRLPPEGELLLVPESKKDLFATWAEVQNRNGGARPLVTVKLHGVPASMRGQAAPPANMPKPAPSEIFPIPPAPPAPPAPQEPKPTVTEVKAEREKPDEPDEVKTDAPDESGPQKHEDEIDRLLAQLLDPALASRDIIIDTSPVLRPVTPAHGKMTWPVSGKVTSKFGKRGRRMHDGVDIPMPKGTPIAAALDGVVLATVANGTRSYRGYGTTVLIDHGNGLVTLYSHCSKLNVKKGQRVRRGEVVGFVGSTGRATANHLHFEVRKNGKAVNPMPYLTSP